MENQPALVSTDFANFVYEARSKNLSDLPVPELLEILDRTLKEGQPLLYKSLGEPANKKQISQLEEFLGHRLSEDIKAWFMWHNGQGLNPHRYLAHSMAEYRPVSIEEIINLLKRDKKNGHEWPNWVPIEVLRTNGKYETTLESACGVRLSESGEGGFGRPDREANIFLEFRTYILALVNKYLDVALPPTSGQYFVHGMSAPLNEVNRYFHTLATGKWEKSSSYTSLECMDRDWNIQNKEQLLSAIQWLENSGHRSEERDNPEKYVAWDLNRACNLASWARTVGWMNEKEAWSIQYRVALRIQKAFNSWEEMGKSYVAGRAKFMGGDLDNWRGEDYIERLLADPTSPFQLPWDTVPSNTPTVDAPITKIRLGPKDNELFNRIVTYEYTTKRIEIELEAGEYIITGGQFGRSCIIKGAKDGETILKGMAEASAATYNYNCTVCFEDVTIIHEDPTEDDSGRSSAFYFSYGHSIFTNCKLHGSGWGISAVGGYIQLYNCELFGGYRGFQIQNGMAELTNCKIYGKEKFGAVCYSSDGTPTFLTLHNCEVKSDSDGILVEAGNLFMTDTKITADEDDGLRVTKKGYVKMERCNIISLQSDALNIPKSDKYFNSVYMHECELGPGDRSAYVGKNGSLEVSNSTIHNGIGAGGGELIIFDSVLKGLLFSNRKGSVVVERSELTRTDSQTIRMKESGMIQLMDCKLSDGVLVYQDSVLRAIRTSFYASKEYCAIQVQDNSHVILEDCEATSSQGDPALIYIENSTFLSAGSNLHTTRAGNMTAAEGSITRLWNTKVINTHEKGLALYNDGDIKIRNSNIVATYYAWSKSKGNASAYNSTITAHSVALYSPCHPIPYFEDTVICAQIAVQGDPYYYITANNAHFTGELQTTVKEHKTNWDQEDGFYILDDGNVTIDTRAMPDEINAILSKLQIGNYTGSYILATTAASVLAEEVEVKIEGALVTISNENGLTKSFQQLLWEWFTNKEECLYGLWNYALDEQGDTMLYPDNYPILPLEDMILEREKTNQNDADVNKGD